MEYREVAPAPELRSLVTCYWSIADGDLEHRVLPDGCIDILLADGRAEVVGTMTRAVTSGARAVMGIRFRPGEAARLLPAAPRELTDRSATLAELSRDGSELEDALHRFDPEALDRILGRWLRSQALAADLRVRTAADLLANGSTVRAAASATALSERQLARRFGARVGIGPKTFARVMRLQRAAHALGCGTTPADAATIAGYADQAHFTRDAVALAGVTPRLLARKMSDSFKTDPLPAP